MVRLRIPKGPATPTESDGDTEHKESSDESEDVEPEDEESPELTLPVGTLAEVRNADPGFLGSFYGAVVTGHLASRGRYRVVYTTLVADDGRPLKETAAAADVRPRPPREGRREFAVHECVEALHTEGWWAGVVSAVRPSVAGAPTVYQVAFPTSRDTMEFQETALRPHRVFEAGRWIPAAEVMMHEGSWWPGVIIDVIGTGMDKYKVKIKSHETGVDDVEFPVVWTVENTQLRPQFRWDGKTWLRRLEEKSATGPTLASRKRPISCGMSLQKEVGETSDGHGSYREKKLKNADVVSEPIPPLSSVCNESSEIKRKSSSYPGESVQQRNAVLAPPSLPLMAGFAHLSDSSLAQNSHLEKSSSQKTITPSTPAAPERRQLEASLFGTFGQPRPLPQGPLLGMQSLNSQTTKKVIASQSVEEARNNVSMSKDLSKPGDDNVELVYNMAAGCGMLSETNSVNFVDPMTIPKVIGGSQHAVSQQGRGSAMDDQLSESLTIQHLPFGSTCPIRSRIEAMEMFCEMPQRPNMNQFKQYGPEFREGMSLGLMLAFASLAESIDMLDGHQDDIGGVVQGKKQGLSVLEENGFDVRVLQSRLETLLCTTR